MDILERFSQNLAIKGDEVSISGKTGIQERIFDISDLKDIDNFYKLIKGIKIGTAFYTEFYVVTSEDMDKILEFLNNEENYEIWFDFLMLIRYNIQINNKKE